MMAARTQRSSLKRERVALRISPERKLLLQRAAALTGSSLSEFVGSSAEEAARKAVREHDIVTLTARDSIAFIEALLNPPAPNEALQRAFQRHADVFGQ